MPHVSYSVRVLCTSFIYPPKKGGSRNSQPLRSFRLDGPTAVGATFSHTFFSGIGINYISFPFFIFESLLGLTLNLINDVMKKLVKDFEETLCNVLLRTEWEEHSELSLK